MNILIIEDQEIKRNEIKALAENMFRGNCKTTCIADYRPAMASIAYMNWDLILLDMSFETIKGTDDESGFQSLAGLQVLQHMRRLNKHIPVVIITSHLTTQIVYLLKVLVN
jgi:CheY-like chemotaxis protein